MKSFRLSARPAFGWLLSLLVLGLVGSLWAPTAHAVDNTVVSAVPADGSTVDASPSSITITFAQPLGTNNQLALTCDGVNVPIGTVIVLADQVSLQAPLVAAAPKGSCAVAWGVTDVNFQNAGNGSLTFTIANDPVPPSSTTSTTPPVPGDTIVPVTSSTVAAPGDTDTGDDGGSSADATESTGQGPLGLFRLFSNLGLAVLFGSLVLIAVAWPEGVEYILTVRFLRTTWMITLVSTYLFAGALAASQNNEGIGNALNPAALTDLFGNTPGKAAIVRLLFVGLSAYAVMRPERTIDPSTQLPALVIPGIAVVTMAFSRAEFGLIEHAVGALHALAMAVWLGGLVLLTRVVLAGPGEEDLVHAVRGFARLATPALWVTVATGAVQLFQLDRGALDSSHGLVVIVKVLLVSVMVFVGVAARQFISQRVSRVDTMTAPLATRLRRALGIEALVGILVLTLTAWLLALTPPGLGVASGDSSLQLGSEHVFEDEGTGVEVVVRFSERVGANDVRVEVVTPVTGLVGLTVAFNPPPGSAVNGLIINQIPLTGTGAAVLEKDDGFILSASGNWELVVTANGVEVDRQVVLVGGDGSDETDAVTTTTTGT